MSEISLETRYEPREENDNSSREIGKLKLNIVREPLFNNKILMFDGTVKLDREVKAGDLFMGDDSSPNIVLNVQITKERCYRIKPVKGEEYTVSENDILSLTYVQNPVNNWREDKEDFAVRWFNSTFKSVTRKIFSVKNYGSKEIAEKKSEEFRLSISDNNYFEMTVKDILTRPSNFKNDIRTYKSGFDYKHEDFEFDPYIIGFWLGDGTSSKPEITTADPEIVTYFEEYFVKFGLELHQYGGDEGITYRIVPNTRQGGSGRNIFLNYLKEKNLLNNKHIPREFLMTSRQNRLRLLAGLLDSDGSFQGTCFDFTQKREGLFDDLIFLCRSLGFSCYKSPCVKICTNGANGPKAGNYFRCSISGEGLSEIPTILPRKQAPERVVKRRLDICAIDLEDLGIQSIYKIITEKERYLMHDFTVRSSYPKNISPPAPKQNTISKLSFGYIKDFNNKIIIHEERAEVVKTIFLLRAQYTYKQTAEKLNKTGIRTIEGEEWSERKVKTIFLNKNKYKGDGIYPAILN